MKNKKNDPDRLEPLRPRLLEISLDHGGNVSRSEGVQVNHVGNLKNSDE